ncbi:hypothetical protein AYJ57_15130 [Salipiger sp. CCB-MM3]|uniref:hypothetical protein n=1 Tax=Roseobacteraceae TaxID=2854170 RepID=UPI00080AA4E0|nr:MULTISPECIES: hypothetical protein [Roseobacteraceae]ANT61801.1 hypothetical protein AYJ57_15130 [Salipiger sp. CCB-MM3]MCA0997775.1 hypothetical protein [Alloyangia pacifica]
MRYLCLTGALIAAALTGACTDNQAINATTGGLAGAAIAHEVSGGNKTAAALGGAAIGTAIGANVPTSSSGTKLCNYYNPQTGASYKAECPR